MRQSWFKRAIILLVSILATSVLFFVIVSVGYRRLYHSIILNTNEAYSKRWSETVDGSLNAMYEHLYDLMVKIYNETNVNPGSNRMDLETSREIQNAIDFKLLSSDDIHYIFLLDTESDLYYFTNKKFISYSEENNLKLFFQQYAPEHATGINNRSWDVVEILEKGYFYKGARLGKYVAGIISDISYIGGSHFDDSYEGVSASFILNGNRMYLCTGEESLREEVNIESDKDTFSNNVSINHTALRNSPASTVFVIRQKPLDLPWQMMALFLILDSAICVGLVLMLSYTFDRDIQKPTRKLVAANQEVSKGNLDYRLDPEEAGSAEFRELFTSFNDMSSQIGQLKIESYDLQLKREQNRLLMLRAQMRPHTFLNGITTISNMTYTSRPEQIRAYISAFAKFTRYMLHNTDEWTTVKEEIRHIDNYIKMQKIRSPEGIEMVYNVNEDTLDAIMPYLLLYSLVENSVKHAMTMVKTMHVSIAIETEETEDFRGIKITEEDDGPGFTDEAIEKLMAMSENDAKEHLGLTNVRYTLNLTYNRNDLLKIGNRKEGGAHIELWIPEKENEDETAGM